MRALRAIATIVFALGALGASGCSQTPIVVPLRSMERPKDVDFVCLHKVDTATYRGVPLNRCHVDRLGNPKPLEEATPVGEYRLHAVVTQLARGELAVVDLGQSPFDTSATLLKIDPRVPGYTFLPVGAVPQDVAADPRGRAVYVASGHERRIDVIPAEMLRGPIDTRVESLGQPLPWPNVQLAIDDGAPGRMAVFDDGTNDRLYVTLPDAKSGPKIAVFEIGCGPVSSDVVESPCATALLPRRLADIQLVLSSSITPKPTTLSCNTTDGAPWWIDFERACYPAAQQSTPVTPKPPIASPESLHLGGIAVANGLIFATDDGSRFLHVFDVSSGGGAEVARLDVGAKTSTIAITEPVPDEVTFANGNAIITCEANRWVGDAQRHDESALVRDELGGFCRAHRYVYAVDYDDPLLGNGTIAVIDLPVTLDRDATDRSKIVKETLDFSASSFVQPMGCDSPALPATRIPVGSFGIGGLDGVPARAVTFVTFDPPSPRPAPADGQDYALPGTERCRSWAPATSSGDANNAFPSPPAKSSSELDFLPPGADKATLIDAQNSWQGDADPRRLRGTFGFVALDNGGIAIVDVDDYDALCRGPRNADDLVAKLQYPTGPAITALSTPNATGEYTYGVVRRHHPRAFRLFDANNEPSVNAIVLASAPTAGSPLLSWGTQNSDQRARPHLFKLAYGSNAAIASPVTTDYVKTSGDSPYGYVGEDYKITYQGALPGFDGTGATLQGDVLRDPNGALCERGVEAFDADPFAHNDVAQVVDDVCDDPGAPVASHTVCTDVKHADCVAAFGLSTDSPLSIQRDLVIAKAFDQHLDIAQHYVVDPKTGVASLAPGSHPLMKSCFPGLFRYVVRARDTWVVVGSVNGYLHRIIADPNAKTPTGARDPDAPCIVDKTQPLVHQGRLSELPGTENGDVPIDPLDPSKTSTVLDLSSKQQVCPTVGAPRVFVNPYWAFAIQQGWDTTSRTAVQSTRDLTFAFGARYVFTPLTVPGGAMPTTIRALQKWKNGADLLNWEMIALVDAIDKGLGVFFVSDLSSSNVFE